MYLQTKNTKLNFPAKASDVPTYVEYGAADVGVVGKDTEEGRNLYEVMDLGFGKCRMCMWSGIYRELLKKNELIRVASKYPNIAKIISITKRIKLLKLLNLMFC